VGKFGVEITFGHLRIYIPLINVVAPVKVVTGENSHFGKRGHLGKSRNFGKSVHSGKSSHLGKSSYLGKSSHFGKSGQLGKNSHFDKSDHLGKSNHFGKSGHFSKSAHSLCLIHHPLTLLKTNFSHRKALVAKLFSSVTRPLVTFREKSFTLHTLRSYWFQ
jgi:hypothetical protein